MEPRNYTVNEMFGGPQVYFVPLYQRQYVWNEENQWAPLWEDVVQIAQDLLDTAQKLGVVQANPGSVESHFFGTLVLKQSGYAPDAATRWRVIDGQQRLTTMQLMLSAVADTFKELGIQDQPIRDLIVKRSSTGNWKPSDVKIEHSSERYGGFKEAMSPQYDKSTIKGPMGDCYRFFSKTAHGWFGDDVGSRDLRASALRNAILVNLRFVAIYLADHEEEHKIFETLNARGEALTEWDKIKNLLLQKADRTPDVELDDFFKRYLDRFESRWWRGGIGRGAQFRPRSDVFADYWIESKTSKEVGVRRVYREFANLSKNVDSDVESFATELSEDADYYEKYDRHGSVAEGTERIFHNRRLSMGAGAFWPALLVLNKKLIKLDGDIRNRNFCFSMLDSFLIRRKILNYQARSYPQLVLELMKAINRADDSADLSKTVQKSLSDGYDWPSDSQIRDAVLNKQMPRYFCSLVLRAIETALISPQAGYKDPPRDLEVEHLMPRAWRTENWPIQATNDDVDEGARRDYSLNLLGNLTLVNGGLNKKLRNKSWDYKRRFIQKSDNLFINKALLDDAPGRWDEDQIELRGEWIAKKVCEIWPRPDDVANN